MFWKKPRLPESPEGQLLIPDDAGELAQKALMAFNRGDFASVRGCLAHLRGNRLSDVDAGVLAELTGRLRIDPVVLVLSAIGVSVFLFLTLWAISLSH